MIGCALCKYSLVLVDLPLLHYVRFACPGTWCISFAPMNSGRISSLVTWVGRIQISRGRNPHQQKHESCNYFFFLISEISNSLKHIRLPTCAILISNMFEASMLPYPYGLLTNGQQWVPFYVVLVSRNLRKKHVQRPEQWPQPWLLAMWGWYYSVKIGILMPFTRIPINRPVQWNARPYLFLVLYLHDFLRQKRQFAMGKYAQTINQATKPVIM